MWRSDRALERGPQITAETPTTVWKLAEIYLGDGGRWQELLDLNRGSVMSDGSTLTQATQTIPAGTTFRLQAGAELPAEKAPTGREYTVKPNDTLWDIANKKLDDPTRYMDLFEASKDVVQPGGAHLVDPDHIEPGWTISVPAGGDEVSPQPDHQPDEKPGHRGGGPDHAPSENQQPPQHGEGKDRGQFPDSPPVTPPEVAAPAEASPETTPVADVDEADAGDDDVLGAPWVLPGLTGGGVLLAGALFIGVQQRRRAQFRARHPGRSIAAPAPELAPAEMTITAAGGPAAATVEFMDEALRRLAAYAHASETPMPSLAAVELHDDLLTLHLSAPTDLPAPWHGTPDRAHWSCSTATEAEDLGPATGWVEAPYLVLVTIGQSDAGDLWLLNCEEFGTLNIMGDQTRARDFARHLAAQLAVNPWSRSVTVDCVGVAEETAPLGERIRYHASGQPGTRVTAEVLADAVAMVDRANGHDTDVTTGRTGQVDDDVWPARMLLVDAAAEDPEALTELLRLVDDQRGRTGTSIVVTGDREVTPGPVLHVTPTGRIVLEQHGLDLVAVRLTSDEATGCGLLYAQSENLEDVDVPVDETATEGWEAYADQAGSLRREHTLPRNAPSHAVGEPVTTLLGASDEDYLREAPVIREDLEAIAPKVPARVRAEVEEADPTLDQDLTDWFDRSSPRPKLSLLGAVTLSTHGKPRDKYQALCIEIAAFLALQRRSGATRDELQDAIGWNDPAKVRKYVNLVREWLGSDPETGDPYLPHADKTPAAKARGIKVYQVGQGLLVDLDLFKRQVLRGQARGGAQGLADLASALELISGHPFTQLREGGWSWLFKGERHDHHVTKAIADVALTVVTGCLETGDLRQARAAAESARIAVPEEEVAQQCMVRVEDAEGNRTEAERILIQDVCNRSDDGEAPTDLPERTAQIIRNHKWLAS